MKLHDVVERFLCCPYDHAAFVVSWEQPEVRGALHCGRCRRKWEVADGIISLMPDHLVEGMGKGVRNHLSERPEGRCAQMVPDPLVRLGSPQACPEQSRRAVADCLSEIGARDREAADYEALFQRRQREIEPAVTVRAFRPPPGGIVADLGVGTGRLLEYANRCALVIGCDYSLLSLKQLQRKKLPNVIPVQADATLLPMRDASVDAILSVGLFHHIPSQALRRRHLAECRRILRSGGECLMSGVYNFGLRDRLRDVQTVYTRDDVHGGADGKMGYHTDNRIFYYNFDHRELRREGERYFAVREVFGFLTDLGPVDRLLEAILGADRADRLWQRTRIGLWFGRLLLMRMVKTSHE